MTDKKQSAKTSSVSKEQSRGTLGESKDSKASNPAALNSLYRWATWLMILSSLSVLTARLYDAPPLRSANDRSRWCTVWSLVERNTYQIDEVRRVPGWDSIDIVRHNDHFYSSKPPLLPRMVAEIYRPIKALTGWTLTSQTASITAIILFLINIVPWGIALVLMSRLIQRHCENPFGQMFLVTSLCWGTMLLPYLTVFNNHTIAATSFMFCLAAAIPILVENNRSIWKFVACGIFAAFGVCNELPSALFGVLLFLLLLRASPRQTLIGFVPGALIPLAAFFITNYHATGGFVPFYAYYGTEKYNFIYEGVPSYWITPRGIDMPRDSTLTYLLHCTFGHHGVFSLTPIVLLSALSWLLVPFKRSMTLRTFVWISLGLSVATMGFYLTKTANYNYSGVTVALRWMLWLTPFWLVSMIPVMNAFGSFSFFKGISCLLLAFSVFSAWDAETTPWTQNWIYKSMEKAKWIDYSDPRPAFERPHKTWIGQLPEGEQQPDYWISFRSETTEGTLKVIRLEDAGPQAESRKLRVIQLEDNQTVSDIVYLINVSLFDSGASVDQFLTEREDGEELSAKDRQFFYGLPAAANYHSSRIRYERTQLRTDAFQCHVGYTHVTLEGADSKKRQFVRDVWYCNDVPFGVLKWEERVVDPTSKKVLTRHDWVPSATGTILNQTDENQAPEAESDTDTTTPESSQAN